MRLGVLDVGSNTVHLLVVDARPGTHPVPAHSEKSVLRLAEQIGPDGALTANGQDALVGAVAQALTAAERLAVDEMLAFATSAVREATNAPEVLARIHAETGVDLRILAGADEARMTFLACRRWFGWSAGRLLMVDIGGGSLEFALGLDEEPELALSLPLGAGRLSREVLGLGPDAAEPPDAATVEQLREYVETSLEPVAGKLTEAGWDQAVATSKTFRILARLAGAASPSEGRWGRRRLTRAGLRQVLGFIRHIPPSRLAELDGVSANRAHQLLAGAVVAEAVTRLLGLDTLEICPWALREGVILNRVDELARAGTC